jgi:hemerythrin-like metal-binding protein
MMTADRFVHYKLGHEKIDADHWHLFVMMNTVATELVLGNNESAVDHIVELLEDLSTHIVTEEQDMALAHYPRLPFHCEQHHGLVKAINAITESIEMNKMVSRYTIDSLSELMVYHVDHADRQFIEWTNSNANTVVAI